MTKARLRANVLLVISGFALLLVAAIVCKFYLHSEDGYSTIKDFSSLLIAIGAAYLAYCFQRRQAFLVSLRDLWKELVEAKGELIEYTHNPNPDQVAFSKAHRALSKAIDTVRGVYRNVGETEDEIGLYPFEPLHDMRKVLDELGFGKATPDKRRAARLRFLRSWNALRWAFLKEFSTPEPPHPITARDAADPPPRRSGRRIDFKLTHYPPAGCVAEGLAAVYL